MDQVSNFLLKKETEEKVFQVKENPNYAANLKQRFTSVRVFYYKKY